LQDITEADAVAEGVSPCHRMEGNDLVSLESYHEHRTGERLPFEGSSCLPVSRYAVLWNSINATPKPVYVITKNTKLISHYQAFPWSLEDFERLHHCAHAAGRWKGHELRVTPNPFVWVLKFNRKENP